MKKKNGLIYFLCLFIVCTICFSCIKYNTVYADNSIYLGGMPAGFSLKTNGAYVVGLCDVVTDNGTFSPAKDANIKVGDIILSIDGSDISTAKDIEKEIINKTNIVAEVKRQDKTISLLNIKPAKDLSGNYKLGIFIREDVCGIGTVTFINGNRFASLGHPVIDDCGGIMEINGGSVFECNITGCIKGEKGKAGELRGVFLKTNAVACIDKNLYCGVYGDLDKNFDKSKLKKIEQGIAVPGDACIYTTIDGREPKCYSISIIKVDNFGDNKNFVVKVIDKDLLEKTGGIVQGMSGSPIVQNDKIVGAITHVFINDPTRGFGISVDKMLNN